MSALPELVQDVVACIFTQTGRVTLNSRTLKVAGTVKSVRAHSRTGTAVSHVHGAQHHVWMFAV